MDSAPPVSMVSDLSVLPYTTNQHFNYEFSDRDLPISLGSDTMVMGENELRNALPTITSTNKSLMIASTDGCLTKRKRNEAFLETYTSYYGDETYMGGTSGFGNKCARIVTSSNESLVTGADRGLGRSVDSGYAAGNDGDHRPSYLPSSNRNQLMGFEVMPKRYHRNAPTVVLTPEQTSNSVFQWFPSGHSEPHSHSLVPIYPTTHPSNSKLQFQVCPMEENVACSMHTPDELPLHILNGEDPLGEAEEVALDDLHPSIPLLGEETERSMWQDLTNDPTPTCTNGFTEVMNEQLPVVPVIQTTPEPTQPPVVHVEEGFHGAPAFEEASGFITDSFNGCWTTPPAPPQGTWVGVAPYTSSIPHSHMGHIPRPKPYASIVPPPPPTNVDVTQSTPQPKGYFSSSLSTAGGEKVFEFKVSPNLPSKQHDFAEEALIYVARFYSDVFLCSLRRDLDLKIATDVRARLCPYTNEANCLKLTMPQDCKPLPHWLKKNPDLKCRLLVLQQVLNTLTVIHSQKLSLCGSFLVWVAVSMEAYLLVNFSDVLQKQQTSITEDSSHTKMDMMAIEEIFKTIVTPHTSFLCSPELGRALRLFEQLINDPKNHCRLAEGARLLGEQRVCRINVDIDLGQNTVLYCLEGERLSTALTVAPLQTDYVWTVHSVPSQEYVLINATAIAEPQMHLVLKPSTCGHFFDPKLLVIKYTD